MAFHIFLYFLFANMKGFFLLLLFFMAFVCSLGLLALDSMNFLAAKLPVRQNNDLLLRHCRGAQGNSPVRYRHFSCGISTFICAIQGFMGKVFLTFYFKTYSDMT